MRPRPGAPAPQHNDWTDAWPIVDVLAHKWTLDILDVLQAGPQRPRDLALAIKPSPSPKMLTTGLRRLDGAGLISKSTPDDDPRGALYALTSSAESLRHLITRLSRWTRTNLTE